MHPALEICPRSSRCRLITRPFARWTDTLGMVSMTRGRRAAPPWAVSAFIGVWRARLFFRWGHCCECLVSFKWRPTGVMIATTLGGITDCALSVPRLRPTIPRTGLQREKRIVAFRRHLSHHDVIVLKLLQRCAEGPEYRVRGDAVTVADTRGACRSVKECKRLDECSACCRGCLQ